ncbi:hypothetical protein BKA62DRAFT_437762 [Auriculariales sp. MPI-PUGE-AT-0066]|nr:hypothetical protein BKA62DRAFT_437762 [Auriculariales sp. MPI-PUGE-AT-0066]
MQPGTGPTYQVLALGPTGNLNAVQTDSSRPIGIYRQDRRSTNPSFEPSGSSKRHVCHQCGAAFSRPSELTTHMHRHSGQKQFVCECGRAYATHSNLQRHKRARHAGPPGTVHHASEHSTSETESDGLAV